MPAVNLPALLLAGLILLNAYLQGGAATVLSVAPPSGTTALTTVTGTLEVIMVDYLQESRCERWFRVKNEETGQFQNVRFEVAPGTEHQSGERVRICGVFQGSDLYVPAVAPGTGSVTAQVSTGTPGMEVLAPRVASNVGLVVQPNVLYTNGTATNTVVHRALIELIVFSNAPTNAFTAPDLVTYSNLFFGATNRSVNADYLENSYGALGFAGDVVICHIAAPSSPGCNYGTWMGQGDVQATAQGFTVGSYAHRVYIVPNVSGNCGWCGLASLPGDWALLTCTDGGTICHELGHNLGFSHAATQMYNTANWVEYGDGSDFMGANYIWQQNNGPHKVQLGWVSAQPIAHAGTYQVNRLEDVPGSVAYPQVLTLPSSSVYGTTVSGWPYYFSYKQVAGFDTSVGGYANGLSIHRWNGGHPATIAVLSDGGIFTDSQIGLTVKQLSHDSNTVSVVITTCTGAAQPYTLAASAAQLAARTPILADVAVGCDVMTLTNFDAISLEGGTIVLTNNQLIYTPPGAFIGNDSFNYSLVNSGGQVSASTVTIYNLSQPGYVWSPGGTNGGTATWNTGSTNWNDGVSPCVWPTNGSANLALFEGTPGTVSVAAPGVAINSLFFGIDGYVIQSNKLTLTGQNNWILVQPNLNATLKSVLAGPVGFTKLGQGTLTLSGANTFNGGLTLSAGTLLQTATTAAGYGLVTVGDTNTGANNLVWEVSSGGTINNPITVANQGSGTVTLGTSGGGSTIFSGTATFNRPLVLNDLSGQTAFNGPISGTPGTVTLAGYKVSFGNANNSFLGNLIIPYGRVFQSDQSGALPTTTAVTNNGTWILNAGGVHDIDGLNGSGNVTLAGSAAAVLSLGNSNGNGAFYGVLADASAAMPLSVVKAGTGLQVLGGANTYHGDTTVQAGELDINTTLSSPGNISVQDGACLKITLVDINQLTPSTYTLGSAGDNLINEFDGVSSAVVAPVNAGTLNLNGNTVLVITNGAFASGPNHFYPLIAFTHLTGTGGFTLGSLPYGVTASVVTNGNSIGLAVTALPARIWTGATNGTWDIGVTTNWMFRGVAAAYADDALVQFDDTALHTTVSNAVALTPPYGIVVSNQVKNYVISGSPIGGAGGLTKLGGGSLTLVSSNNYAGATVVAGGTLKLGTNTALGYSLTVTNQGVLDINGQNLTASMVNNPLYLGGSGAAGTVLTNSSGTRGMVQDVELLQDTTVASANTLFFGGSSAGNGVLNLNGHTLTKSGSGTLILNGLNFTNDGSLVINAGTLQLLDNYGNNQLDISLAGNGSLTVNPGASVMTYRWTAGVNLALPVILNGGTLGSGWPGPNGATYSCPILVNSNSTFNFGGGYGNLTFSGNLTGPGGLTVTGDSLTRTFTGTNSYGWTTIAAGTLQIGSGGTNGTLGLGPVTNKASLTFNRSDAYYVSNTITGTGSLAQNGTGTVCLCGSNSYTGGTALNAGVLSLVGPQWGNTNGPLGKTNLLTFNKGILQFSAVNTYDYSPRFSRATNQPFQIDTGGQTVTFAAGLNSTNGGSLTKLGGGTLSLTGTNIYDGPTLLAGGTLSLTSAHRASGDATVNDGTTLAIVVTSTNPLSPASLTEGNAGGALVNVFSGIASTNEPPIKTGTLALNSRVMINASGTFTDGQTYPLIGFTNIAGPGSFQLGSLPSGFTGTLGTNGGTLVLTVSALPSPHLWTGAVNDLWDLTSSNWTVYGSSALFTNGALVQLDDTALVTAISNSLAVAPAAILVSNVTKDYFIGGNALTGSGSLTKLGTGALTLSGTNDYSGTTTVSAGKLVVHTYSDCAGNLTVNDGAAWGLVVDGTNQIAPNLLTEGSNGGWVTNEFAGLGSPSAAPVNASALTLNSTVVINILSGSLGIGQYPLIRFGAIAGSGGFKLGSLPPGGFAASLATNNNTLVLNITGMAPRIWTGAANGVWDLTATNWLLLGQPATYADNTAVQFDDSALTTAVSNAFPVSPGSLIVSNSAKSYTLGGPIGGGTGLLKAGSGTLSLTGSNTYTGPTTLAGGKLILVSSSDSSGNLNVNDGTTLGVLVTGTNQLVPATLTEGSAGGFMTNEFTGLFSTNVAPIAAGTLTLNGVVIFNIPSGSLALGNFPLISFTTLNGSGSLKLGVLPYSGFTASIQTNGHNIVLNIAALPPRIWTGAVNGNWDITNTVNWLYHDVAATYTNDALVQMDDTAHLTTLNNAVTVTPPLGLVISNVTQNYLIGGNPIAGAGALVKSGSGSLTLTGTNAYSGGTKINGGSLILGTNNALLPTGALYLNAAQGGNSPATFDASTCSQTLGGLYVLNSASNLTSGDDVIIGVGKTVTVNGNVTVGANATVTTCLTMSGAGTLAVVKTGGLIQIGGGTGTVNNNTATNDMSGLGTFTAALGTTGTLRVGDTSSSSGTGPATLILASNTVVTAATGDIGGTSGHADQYTVILGGSSTTLNLNTLNLGAAPSGGNRSSGAMLFNSAGGTLKIRTAADTVAGRAAVNVAATTSGTGGDINGLFDVTGHAADLRLGTLQIGHRVLGTAASCGNTTGSFAFDQGTLDVTNVVLGKRVFVSDASGVTATLTIGGGTALIANLSLAQCDGLGTGTNLAVLNFTGGNITLSNGITQITAPTNWNAGVLNLNGAVLDLNGKAVTNVSCLNFLAGTLLNAGELNSGAGLVKTGPGLLTLGGTNTYSGPTVVSNGILRVNGWISTGAVTVVSGAMLSGTGTIRGPVALNGGAALSPGSSNAPGILTLSNSLSLSPGTIAVFDLNKTNALLTNDSVVVSGSLSATNSILTVLNQGPSLAVGDSFKLFSQPVTGFSTLNFPPGYFWTNKLAVNGSIQVSALAPPQITPNVQTIANRRLNLSGSGGGRQIYILLSATNLLAPVWVPIATNMADGAGGFQFSNVMGTNRALQFFRVRTP